jgi:FAD/FMN-containing dehydrogenase
VAKPAHSGGIQQPEWRNWGGNQVSRPAALVWPASEADAIAITQASLRDGFGVRVAGAGHSFTPIVSTAGTLLQLDAVSGVISVDADNLRAEVRAGSRLSDLGRPLWEAGVAIANQGDIDAQSIAGAVATGTKGSGLRSGSMSSTVRGMRLISGSGEVIDICESEPELLRAAQVSVGMLGIVLRLTLEVVPAYLLHEENAIMTFDDMAGQWEHLSAEYRHFSFWWMPTDRSAALYELGDVPADHCFVKLLREIPADAPPVPVGAPDRRTDRSYRIYPDGTTAPRFHELEYMVDASDAWEVIDEIRGLMRSRFPHEISPLQIRWQRADNAYMSPQYGRDSVSVSVSGEMNSDYLPFLRAVDRQLQRFQARPHWGKLHFLTADRVRALYPEFEVFQRVRRSMDPRGRFLNDHLRELFGP